MLLFNIGEKEPPQKQVAPETMTLSEKNDLSGNWIINDLRQRDEDVGLEKPSGSAV